MRNILFLFFALLWGCSQNTGDAPNALDKQGKMRGEVPDGHFCATIAREQFQGVGAQDRAVVLKKNLWPNGSTLRVKLVGGTAAQRAYLTNAFLEWQKHANLKVSYVTTGTSDIRVSFASGQGSWSYVGTDSKSVPQSQATMNIGWLGSDVCLHEIGHALGMAHEQASPNSTICWDKEAVYKALGAPPNNWTRETVDWNVFRKLTPAEADATVFDPKSIMQYSVPASWLCQPSNGIPGGTTLSDLDKAFMAEKYPFPNTPNKNGVTLKPYQKDSIKKWMEQ